MTSDDIKQRGGLHIILDAMHVKDSGVSPRKPLLKYLWPAVSTPFQKAFGISERGLLERSLCNLYMLSMQIKHV